MIDVYSWTTGNARKVYIMLEETGLPYRVHPIDINKGDQFTPEFLKISPNNKIPAIIDQDGPGGAPYAMFESGAILIYLAEKCGRFLPTGDRARPDVLQWLMFQMGGVGPSFGQASHFVSRKDQPGMEYGLQRYVKEAARLCGVMDRRLGETEYLGGPDYTIADIATFPWCQDSEKRGFDYRDYPNFARWFDTIAERDAVKAADAVAERLRQGRAAE